MGFVRFLLSLRNLAELRHKRSLGINDDTIRF